MLKNARYLQCQLYIALCIFEPLSELSKGLGNGGLAGSPTPGPLVVLQILPLRRGGPQRQRGGSGALLTRQVVHLSAPVTANHSMGQAVDKAVLGMFFKKWLTDWGKARFCERTAPGTSQYCKKRKISVWNIEVLQFRESGSCNYGTRDREHYFFSSVESRRGQIHSHLPVLVLAPYCQPS